MSRNCHFFRFLPSLALSLAFATLGCTGDNCSLIAHLSYARLTLHLPPQASVKTPETVFVCRGPECATGVITTPPIAGSSAHVQFTFVQNTTSAAIGTTVEGSLDLAPGGVRILTITWIFDEKSVNPADPRNEYDVEVKDANGAVTGKLSARVTYEHSTNCGYNFWTASASD